MTKKQRATWDAAVSYYDHEFASTGLLFDHGLNAINNTLAGAKTLSGLSLSADHRHWLDAAAPIYKRYFWPQHDSANRAWIADVARRTAPVARQIVDRLTSFYGVCIAFVRLQACSVRQRPQTLQSWRRGKKPPDQRRWSDKQRFPQSTPALIVQLVGKVTSPGESQVGILTIQPQLRWPLS